MTSGIRKRRALTLATLSLAPAICFGALDVAQLLAKLARPAPATTSFVEARFSKLLVEPLVVKGQLEYHEDGALVRAVSEPFRERTEIKGDTVTIERVGKSPRRFALSRAPELRSMLAGFGAVLGGTRAKLERDFELAATGDTTHWRLAMTPKLPALAKYVRNIVMEGHEGEPRCVVVTQPDDEASVMVVGNAAAGPLPQPLTRESLERFCASQG
ncbi:MAG TPA: LolA-related protein [Steroidobacteraceae bacterium]|nr:LolA-related protein [Steroidobacteraceae bacterium]